VTGDADAPKAARGPGGVASLEQRRSSPSWSRQRRQVPKAVPPSLVCSCCLDLCWCGSVQLQPRTPPSASPARSRIVGARLRRRSSRPLPALLPSVPAQGRAVPGALTRDRTLAVIVGAWSGRRIARPKCPPRPGYVLPEIGPPRAARSATLSARPIRRANRCLPIA
jgi:hypothetical protein